MTPSLARTGQLNKAKSTPSASSSLRVLFKSRLLFYSLDSRNAAFAGASSIEGGITIALEKMDTITLSSDKKIAAIGPGNRWLKVYETLEKDGLAVIGGRVRKLPLHVPTYHRPYRDTNHHIGTRHWRRRTYSWWGHFSLC
jgi:hypothetical protein